MRSGKFQALRADDLPLCQVVSGNEATERGGSQWGKIGGKVNECRIQGNKLG